MTHILTLIASDTPLTARHFDGLGTPSWLEKDKAAECPLPKPLSMEEMKNLRTKFDPDKIDVFCTSAANRRKKLFLADMDSTIVTSETLDELAEEAGIKDQIAKITDRAMRGELDFHAALKERVGLLKNLPAEALDRTYQRTVLSLGAEKLISELRGQGVFCVLVSGGFTFFTQKIATLAGFHAHHGNILEIANDKLTGQVKEPILDKDTKLRFLKLYAEEQGLEIGDTIAIGDGANDLPMLLAAGLGIGYKPKPILEDTLLNCIRHTDLTSVLYMQGYKT